MEVLNVVIDDSIAISVDSLSVEYNVYVRKKLKFGKVKPILALDNISFDIMKGECVAILGKNGAGKSTLLDTIAGRLRPKIGSVNTEGKVYTLSGANPGLIPILSGRENVRMLAEVYGIEKEKIPDFESEVEQFCELGEAFDRPYNTLSSGMAGRIGFGFTTSLIPEILLMDETLGVGDEEFRKKAEKKAEKFMQRGETILLSTHSLGLAKKMCKRGIVLDQGILQFDGEIEKAIKKYLSIINGEN